jgi:T5SS/PEP-CTERM-associated repeat protein
MMRSTTAPRAVIGLNLCLALFTGNACGQSWIAVSPSSWFTPSNWSGGVVPTASHGPQINNGGTAQITQSNAVAYGVALGKSSPTSSGTLEISGAGALNSAQIAGAATEIHIGHTGMGHLSISAGGKLDSHRVGFGVFAENARGTATINGAGSLMDIVADILVGVTGDGLLSIENGGAVKTGSHVTLALNAGSIGEVSVNAGSINK